MQDKRFFVGVAYNLLIDRAAGGDHGGGAAGGVGAGPNRQGPQTPSLAQIMASSGHDRQKLYHHPAIRLPRTEMGRDNGDAHWRDRPLLLDHGNMPEYGKRPVGRILSSRIVQDRVEISGEVTDPSVIAKLDAGKFKSLSVGYQVKEGPAAQIQGAAAGGGGGGSSPTGHTAEGRPYSFHVEEVSLCEVPFFDGCAIKVLASDANTAGEGGSAGQSGSPSLLPSLPRSA